VPGGPEVGLNGCALRNQRCGDRKTGCYPGTKCQETVTTISWSSLPISEQGVEANHFQITEGRCRHAEKGSHSYAKPKEEEGREEVLSKSTSVS